MSHVWMRVFGTGDTAVRALPGLLGVITIPLAYLAGGGLRSAGRQFDRRAAVITMLVVATSPWAIRYSTENRMYSLAIVLVLLGFLAVTKAMRSPTPGPLAAVALVTAALAYTTYWSFFLLAVVGAVLVFRCIRAQPSERGAAIRLLVAVAAGGVLFVPWLPVFVSQLRHTGTPWGTGPRPIALITTITQFGGSNYFAARVVTVLLVAMAVVALSGLAIPHISVAGTPDGTRRVRIVFAIGAATLLVGVGEAMLSNTAYQVRYAAIVFPFAALVAGSALLEPSIRAVVLSVLVVFSLVAAQHWITMERTESASVASVINEKARRRRRGVLPRSGRSRDHAPHSRIDRPSAVDVPLGREPALRELDRLCQAQQRCESAAVRAHHCRAGTHRDDLVRVVAGLPHVRHEMRRAADRSRHRPDSGSHAGSDPRKHRAHRPRRIRSGPVKLKWSRVDRAPSAEADPGVQAPSESLVRWPSFGPPGYLGQLADDYQRASPTSAPR